MLEAAKESGAVILCRNPSAMIEKARNYGIFGVEIIGYDDIEALPSFSGKPFLSTVNGAWEEEGRTAVRMILDALAGKRCAGECAIKLQYISRESFPF